LLIEQAGFSKGHPMQSDLDAAASVSTKHTLSLTNRGAATTSKRLQLAGELAAGVRQVFQVRLGPESTFAGVDWHRLDHE
jgi:UDP-N-acetylmuramate dehydrogenase